MSPSNKEVKTGTEVVLSCSISGISALATVLWKKSDAADLSDSVTGYTVAAGTFANGAQESTLTLTAAVNTADTTFTCVVTAPGAGQTAQETTVQLDVFGTLRTSSQNLKTTFLIIEQVSSFMDHNTPVPCPVNDERRWARGYDFHIFIEISQRLSSR